MPFKITGRVALMTTSEVSVKSWRVANAPPVDRRHSASDNPREMVLRLSSATTWQLRADTNRSCSLRGAERSGASSGSISARTIRTAHDFAEPCSPFSTRTG